jgi:hypothetical protein
MKGTALAAITRSLSFEAGAKTANDPPCLKIPVPTGDGIHLSDFEPVVETHMASFSDTPITVSMASKLFAMEPILPVQIASRRCRHPPWPGVRSCLYHGFVCPQLQRAGWNIEEFWVFSRDDGTISEDCLNLNVWPRDGLGCMQAASRLVSSERPPMRAKPRARFVNTSMMRYRK